MVIQPVKAVTLASLCAVLALGACTRTSTIDTGLSSQPDPLPPSPTQQVERAGLPPAGNSPTPPPAPQTQVPVTQEPAPVTEPADQIALNEPTPAPQTSSQPVTREALIGAWTVSANGANCQIFLALTKWQGGFRAAQRGCAGAGLGDVQAWNVADNRVVLLNSNGGTAATLSRTGEERYDGSSTSGGNVTFSR